MITKLYEKFKKLIKENLYFICLLILTFVVFNIPLPYYVDAPGGLVDVADHYEVSGKKNLEGQIYLAYVSEYRATIPIYLIALLKKDWDIIKKEAVVADNETARENELRSRLLLDEANQNAVIVAYQKANKPLTITEENLYITLVDSELQSDLKINDIIKTVDGQKFTSQAQLKKYIQTKKVGEKLSFVIMRNGKEKTLPIEVRMVDHQKMIGLATGINRKIKTDPDIEFHFANRESGPSGGFMMSLAIYDTLKNHQVVEELKIAGTGTIDADGTVGEIGGIKHKIIGAHQEGAEIFFAPAGENYHDALKLAQERNYQMEIIEVRTLDDAIAYLDEKKKLT